MDLAVHTGGDARGGFSAEPWADRNRIGEQLTEIANRQVARRQFGSYDRYQEANRR